MTHPNAFKADAVARGVLLDAACLALIALANPLVWRWASTRLYLPPDAAAYLAFSDRLAAGGWLFLEGWGHLDRGLILPPVFPALIALAKPFVEESMLAGERVSVACMLVAVLPCYALMRRHAGRAVAVVSVVALPLNLAVFEIAFSPLSESSFILLLACLLLLFERLIELGANARARDALAVGAACGLLFLTRQLGLVVLGFCGLLTLFAPRSADRAQALRQSCWLGAGFALVLAPYALVLFAQSGQHPLQQYFRFGRYTISTQSQDFEARRREIRAGTTSDYASVLQMRARMRQLIPDASEMYEFVLLAKRDGSGDSLVASIAEKIRSDPRAIASRFGTNLRRLAGALGPGYAAAFALLIVTPFVLRRPGEPGVPRWLLAALVLFYVLSVSAMTDKVERYVTVMVPFAILHVGREAVCAGAALRARVRGGGSSGAVLGAALALVLHGGGVALMDRFDEARLTTLGQPAFAPFRALGSVLEPQEPVFSATPTDAVAVGGTYRALPMDELGRIAHYAHRTGVRWLLVTRNPSAQQRMRAFPRMAWYAAESAAEGEPSVELCCRSQGDVLALYRIPAP